MTTYSLAMEKKSSQSDVRFPDIICQQHRFRVAQVFVLKRLILLLSPPLNRITLGQRNNDNNNQMILPIFLKYNGFSYI